MNIITNKILSSLLVAVCFIQTATGQISCRAEIKDGHITCSKYRNIFTKFVKISHIRGSRK